MYVQPLLLGLCALHVRGLAYMVPPTLLKIWQLRLECVLYHLEPDTEDVPEKQIPENESLQEGKEGEDPGFKGNYVSSENESLQVGEGGEDPEIKGNDIIW